METGKYTPKFYSKVLWIKKYPLGEHLESKREMFD